MHTQNIGFACLQSVGDAEVEIARSVIVVHKLVTVCIKQICARVSGTYIGFKCPCGCFVGNDRIVNVFAFCNIIDEELIASDNTVSAFASRQISKYDSIVEVIVCSVRNEGNADCVHIGCEYLNAVIFAKHFNSSLNVCKCYVQTNVLIFDEVELIIPQIEHECFFDEAVNFHRLVEIDDNVRCEGNGGVHPITNYVCLTLAVLIGQVFHYDVAVGAIDVLETACAAVVEILEQERPVVSCGSNRCITPMCLTYRAIITFHTVLRTSGSNYCCMIRCGMCAFGRGNDTRTVRVGIRANASTTVCKVVGVFVLFPIFTANELLAKPEFVTLVLCVGILISICISVRVAMLLCTGISVFTKRCLVLCVGILVLIPSFVAVGVDVLIERRCLIIAPTTFVCAYILASFFTVLTATVIKLVFPNFLGLNVDALIVVVILIGVITATIGTSLNKSIVNICTYVVVVGVRAIGKLVGYLILASIGCSIVTELNSEILTCGTILVLEPICGVTNDKSALCGIGYRASIGVSVRIEVSSTFCSIIVTVGNNSLNPLCGAIMVECTITMGNAQASFITTSTTVDSRVTLAYCTVLGQIKAFEFCCVVIIVIARVFYITIATFFGYDNTLVTVSCAFLQFKTDVIYVVSLGAGARSHCNESIANTQGFLVVMGHQAVFGIMLGAVSAVETDLALTRSGPCFYIPTNTILIGVFICIIVCTVCTRTELRIRIISARTSVYIYITACCTVLSQIVVLSAETGVRCIVALAMVVTILTSGDYSNTRCTSLVCFVGKGVLVLVFVVRVDLRSPTTRTNFNVSDGIGGGVVTVGVATFSCIVVFIYTVQTALGTFITLYVVRNACIIDVVCSRYVATGATVYICAC